MPWKECSVMDERLRFVAQLLDGEAMSEVCRAFGISRKTGYKIFETPPEAAHASSYRELGAILAVLYLGLLIDRFGPERALWHGTTRPASCSSPASRSSQCPT